MKVQSITAATIIHLRQTNHVVYVYPRRAQVSVDGSKRYSIAARELASLRQANNGLVN